MPNFALLIYDKKKKGFRLVPVDSHVRFEKVRAKAKLPPIRQPINIQKIMEKQGVQMKSKTSSSMAARQKNLLSKIQGSSKFMARAMAPRRKAGDDSPSSFDHNGKRSDDSG